MSKADNVSDDTKLKKRKIKKLKMVTLEDSESLVKAVTGVDLNDHNEVLYKINSGITFASIKGLGDGLATTQKEVAALLSIPPSTMSRRKKEGHLTPIESDRVVRFARLKDLALELMQGKDQAAIAWLRTPQEIFGGATPLEHAKTEIGARQVEDLIGRLKYGVFS